MCCVQSKLYPTIGLQTPGEIVEANFGQRPFVYDIENYIQVFAFYYSWDDQLVTLINFILTSNNLFCYHDYTKSSYFNS